MKRGLADHNVPAKLARFLKAFDIKLAHDLGWEQLKNGKLLAVAEKADFDVLLTADRSLEDEQKIAGRSLGVVVMSTNSWKIVQNYVPVIVEALHECKPSQVISVDCGKLARSKFKKPGR